MATNSELEDVVLFHILPRDAASLEERLQTDRLVWTYFRNLERLVAVALRPEPGDLAALLRAIQSWASEHALATVGFEVDGRTYTLLSEPLVLAAAR